MNKNFLLQIISVVGGFLAGIWIPLRLIGHAPQAGLEIFFNLLIPVVGGINVYFHFRSPRESVRQLSSWMCAGLMLDILCLVPVPLLAFVFWGKTFGALLFLNLCVVRHVSFVKKILDHFPNLQPITYRLVPIAVMMPLLLHIITCGWIALGSGTAGPDADQTLEYVKGLYWAFTTLTTVGYGDISAKTIPQMLFTCGVQLVGVAVFGFILSNVASLLARRDAAREHHMDNLDRVENFMNSHKIPGDMRVKVRSFYHYMWQNKKGYSDNSVLNHLPKKIQSELFFHINRPVLEQVPFLRGASQDLFEDLMNELELQICVPGERIFRAGDHGDAMYFIYKGAVEILNKNEALIAKIGEGAFFGEMALLTDGHRNATVRAIEFCDLYVLKRASFNEVCSKYPQFLENINEVVRKRVA